MWCTLHFLDVKREVKQGDFFHSMPCDHLSSFMEARWMWAEIFILSHNICFISQTHHYEEPKACL